MSVSLHEVRFSHVPASTLSHTQWEGLVQLNASAVQETYGDSAFRNHPAVQTAIGKGDSAAYRSRLLIPGAENPKQRYKDPFITMAAHKSDGNILSWVYSASNTSGDLATEKMEASLPLKRWHWLGWIATDPRATRSGLATATVAISIARSELLQPVSAYAWPGDYSGAVLRRNGLRLIGDQATFPKKHADEFLTSRYVSVTNRFGYVQQLPHKLIAKARAASLDVE